MHERRGDPCLYERVRASGPEQTKMRERCSSLETDEKLKREKERKRRTMELQLLQLLLVALRRDFEVDAATFWFPSCCHCLATAQLSTVLLSSHTKV